VIASGGKDSDAKKNIKVSLEAVHDNARGLEETYSALAEVQLGIIIVQLGIIIVQLGIIIVQLGNHNYNSNYNYNSGTHRLNYFRLVGN
jgi:hypothetical protein